MNQQTLSNNAEINLLDLIWDLVCMWKPIVAVMLVCSILVTGAMYVRTGKQAVAAREEIAKLEQERADALAAEGPTEEELEVVLNDLSELRKVLTDVEMATVERTAEQYRYSKNRHNYLSRAPYYQMNLDTLSTFVMTVYFDIRQENAPFFTENARMAIYKNIRSYIDKAYNVNEKYDRDIFSVGSGTSYRDEDTDTMSMTISISIIFDKTIEEEELKTEVERIVKNAMRGVTYRTTYNVHNDSRQGISDNRYTANRDLLAVDIEYNKAIDAFNDNQKQAFALITKLDMSERVGHEDEEEVVEEPEELPEIDVVVPSFGVKDLIKYLVLGAVLGVFLLAMVLFAKAALFLRVKNPDEVCAVYGIKNYGQVRQYPYKTKWERFCFSKAVYDFRYKQGKDAALSELKSYMVINHGDKMPVMFTMGNVLSEVTGLGESTIDVTSEPRSARTKLIEENEEVVLVVESGKVSARAFDELMNCFIEQGRKPLGIIVTEG